MIKFSWPSGKPGGILVADNAIDAEVCRSFLNYASSVIDVIGSPGKTISGVRLDHKNSTDMVISHITIQQEHGLDAQPMLRMFENEVLKAVSACVSHYRHQTRALWEWHDIVDSGFQVQRYKPCDGYYREHYDSAPWIPQTANRVLSVVIYLNTVEVGGETEFPLHETAVAPVIGRMCLFPSNFTHPHSGNPSFSQEKWIISTFLSSHTGGAHPLQTLETMATPIKNHTHDDGHVHHHDGEDILDNTDTFEWDTNGS